MVAAKLLRCTITGSDATHANIFFGFTKSSVLLFLNFLKQAWFCSSPKLFACSQFKKLIHVLRIFSVLSVNVLEKDDKQNHLFIVQCTISAKICIVCPVWSTKLVW